METPLDRPFTPEEMAGIRSRSRDLSENEPCVASARFDRASGLLHLTLTGSALQGTQLSVPARLLPNLAQATDEQLETILLSPPGWSLRWPLVGEGVGIGAPALVKLACGVLDSQIVRNHLSRIGSVSSPKKAAAVRENGKKGGRPRKTPVAS